MTKFKINSDELLVTVGHGGCHPRSYYADEMMKEENNVENIKARLKVLEDNTLQDHIDLDNARAKLKELESFLEKMKNEWLKDVDNYQKYEENQNDRLEKLEKYLIGTSVELDMLKEEDIKKHEKWLFRLEKLVNKQPHKCPVCDGETFRPETQQFCERKCLACEGKGIIWG